MSTTSSYIGRTVDLFISQGATYAGQDQQITLGFGNPSEVTTGVQKAVQRFVFTLMSRIGSVAANPNTGSGFLAEIQSVVATDTDLQSAFNSACQAVIAQLTLDQETTDPNDEIIVSATLLNADVSNPTDVSIRLQITTAAGVSREVVVPVPLAIKQ